MADTNSLLTVGGDRTTGQSVRTQNGKPNYYILVVSINYVLLIDKKWRLNVV